MVWHCAHSCQKGILTIRLVSEGAHSNTTFWTAAEQRQTLVASKNQPYCQYLLSCRLPPEHMGHNSRHEPTSKTSVQEGF